MAQTHNATYTFRLDSEDLRKFRLVTYKGGVKPRKTATADVLRAMVRMYNSNPCTVHNMLKPFVD